MFRKTLALLVLSSTLVPFVASAASPTTPFTPAHVSTVVTPATAIINTPVTITTRIRNTGSAGTMLVDLEVYNGGSKVGQKFFESVAFAAGEEKTFTMKFTPTRTGSYGVAVGLFKERWAGLYQWLGNTAKFVATTTTTVPNSTATLTSATPAPLPQPTSTTIAPSMTYNTNAPLSLSGDERSCDQIVAANTFYQDMYLQARREQNKLYVAGQTADGDILKEVACFPSGIWLTGSNATASVQRVRSTLSAAQNQRKVPVFVTYSQPAQTSVRWWSGLQGDTYIQYMTRIADAIGTSTAWVIVEPDALGLSVNYNQTDRAYRLNELQQVVKIFKSHAPNARIYLDAGHNRWRSVATEVELLKQAGIAEADGFVTNISNFQKLGDEVAYGLAISKLVGDKHFIVDTARNGLGPSGTNEWCNAPGRALGVKPTTNTGNALIDAFFWVKPPGESDGTCNGGPTAGQFWTTYALMLSKNIPR